ncbi:hypothetical protein [Tenggerimyces flavus]|uniref:Uncharacterized protein n=1 Tax=Tenggerimyces flavus TaxID=1708749 RepID=A0ABV7YP84_9ACTN|nr:hypothetical protein [Tenggerimyces flavus]MBM7787782.1 hypothetical protein [Tenggerimyces flavus]
MSDEIDRARHDEFELCNLELSLATREAFEDGARLSPAARRFMAGEMDADEARQLGFVPVVSDDG